MRIRRDHFDRLFIAAAALAALFGCNFGKQENATPEGASLGLGSPDKGTTRPAAANNGRSSPPTVAEWSSVGEVTVRHSSALGCETKMVREWLRVSCSRHSPDNAPTGVQLIRPAGDKEIFTFTTPTLASLVLPVRPGVNTEARFTWQKWGARTLRVTWPNGAPSASMTFDSGAP